MPPDEDGAQPEPETGPLIIDSLDPREWEARLPKAWGLVLDIEIVDRVLGVMKSAGPPAVHPAYEEAVRFLTQSSMSLRADLAVALLKAYGIPVPERSSSPFETAGKARAFGVDIPAPAGNT